ncbi:hypothetical protein EYF80_009618 [Liparis tanakae]|uniref:Uncharacterized protein n=1 Tax=Liparis tanakae TaxID=230148 RepID=A0A4Z2IQP9_9TELE|nr:hypothetical protein EYF80_009618 [Liparis tanakae]
MQWFPKQNKRLEQQPTKPGAGTGSEHSDNVQRRACVCVSDAERKRGGGQLLCRLFYTEISHTSVDILEQRGNADRVRTSVINEMSMGNRQTLRERRQQADIMSTAAIITFVRRD